MILTSFSELFPEVSLVALLIVLLVALTNICTQVFKKVIDRRTFPAQLIVFIVAELLTLAAYFVIWNVKGWSMHWYYYIVSMIVGVVVAFGAMFGYDYLYRELFQIIQKFMETWKKNS